MGTKQTIHAQLFAKELEQLPVQPETPPAAVPRTSRQSKLVVKSGSMKLSGLYAMVDAPRGVAEGFRVAERFVRPGCRQVVWAPGVSRASVLLKDGVALPTKLIAPLGALSFSVGETALPVSTD